MSPRRAIRPSIWAALGVAIWLGAPASAQVDGIEGTVRTRAGDPLGGVAVEAWREGRRLDARVTGEEGTFVFPAATAARATELRAGRLGFRPLRVPVTPGRARYELTLTEQPVSVEGVVVETPRDFCQGEDEEAARALWNAARGHYHPALDTLGVVTYVAYADSLVDRERIGPLPLPANATDQRGSSPLLRFSWARRIRRSGYAFATRRTVAERSFDSWVYPPLHADFAPHFASDLFGELHDFAVASEDEQGFVLTFCPRDEERPGIKGTLTLTPDTTLASVEWVFLTPEPVENAGGRAAFGPVTASRQETYLLPTEGLFWRKLPTGTFYEEYQRFEGWHVARGDSVPHLPARGADERGPPVPVRPPPAD